MLFNLNKCSYFELKLFSWQIRLFAFGHAFGKWRDFCLPCAILTSFLRREKSFAQAKRYVYLKIIPSVFYIRNLIEF